MYDGEKLAYAFTEQVHIVCITHSSTHMDSLALLTCCIQKVINYSTNICIHTYLITTNGPLVCIIRI